MAARTTLTFAEFERLPESAGPLELIEGEVFPVPPAERPHNEVARRLQKQIEKTKLADGTDVYVEVGFRLDESWLIPDVSVPFPGQPGPRFFEGAPRLAVEVVSASNTARELEHKVRLYLRGGAEEVWVVYPDAKSVWVYASGKRSAECHSGMLKTDVLGGEAIDLAAVFPEA
ncbi:MAG: Uma2 family endonuclease [Bryobacteraceae bacterium]|nr:Uma2 family endonuclease [Bryobacteraceae bacterium]